MSLGWPAVPLTLAWSGQGRFPWREHTALDGLFSALGETYEIVAEGGVLTVPGTAGPVELGCSNRNGSTQVVEEKSGHILRG